MSWKSTSLLLIIFFSASFASVAAQKRFDLAYVKKGFVNPQDSTRTKVWWFHGETETTREGITADLEAFKTAGIGGIVYYDQSHGKAEMASAGFSSEWWEMLKFASAEAARLGLSFELHISNGYVAGGPWITNETGMKRLTATETIIAGGKNFTGKLPEPENKFNFYKDVAVLAFPVFKGSMKNSSNQKVEITSTEKLIDTKKLFVQKQDYTVRIPKNEKGVLISLKFETDFEARSISYKMQPRGKATTSATNVPAPPSDIFTGTGYRVLPDFGQLEVSYDGIHYTKVCDLKPIYKAHESWRQKTISFKGVKAKYYRLYLHDWWEKSEKNQQLLLNSIILNSSAKVDQYEEKSGLFSEYIEKDRTPDYGKAEVINSKQIIDISNKMDENGILRWDAPQGDWMVMRFAYEPTGANTKHGRANLLGRESDKLSKAAAELHWNHYVAVIADSLKNSNSGKLSGIAMDSHEAGSQNWTDNFIQEFKERRGYDPLKYLPCMMGYVVDNVNSSDAFLFDIRRNIADLIADNYYGTFDKLAAKRGLSFTAQAIGNALCFVGDPIQAKSKVQKPQGEFWIIHPDGNYDIKESSSAAHLYGKPIASAEAFTDALYSTSLGELKSLADYAYAFGINEFVICASAYQPWTDKIPGSTGGGRQYAINRNNTWWNYSKPFWDYQTRSAYLMRSGKSVADLCVYLGENAPVKILTHRLPDIPGGFDFDAFSADALLTRMDVDKGKIILPDGISYKLMVIEEKAGLTLKSLRKIADLVAKGGIIYSTKPKQSGSAEDIGKEKEYQKLVTKLWGENPSVKGSRKVGKGRIFWGGTLQQTLKDAGIDSDITLDSSDCKTQKIYFTHRTLADAEMYFIKNHKSTPENNIFSFNAEGKYAQVWNPVTGERMQVKTLKNNHGKTSLELSLEGWESFFIFITDKEENLPLMNQNKSSKIETFNNGWNVDFDKKMGGPGNVFFESLQDWTKSDDLKIKYYSGTAIYKKDIEFEHQGKKVFADLGNPGFVARIFVNENDAGVVWCSPWKVDITSYLKKGLNKIEIHVANSLMNRMIYDSQLPEKERVTYSYPAIASEKDSLQPSGLTGFKIILVDL
ncbi:glycosyl hydrolase family 2 [Chryseobacterium sp. Leaf405]|uniref:glycosyl hydrolase n=1 Tax=Chryseobacterium sp. Leaf405 TaxID=1736367 RepID=UPI000701A8C5|nr:glycosyl hydrolase [Chryseobacterium sp. Leaf405]KQT26163.1 glycosyl hydrolase family 2 [Chryseobacterium sp. Leaf405]